MRLQQKLVVRVPQDEHSADFFVNEADARVRRHVQKTPKRSTVPLEIASRLSCHELGNCLHSGDVGGECMSCLHNAPTGCVRWCYPFFDGVVVV